MSFRIVIFAWRKPDITPLEFKDYYENNHMSLVKSIAGDKFPLTHTRHYIQRESASTTCSTVSSIAYPAVTFVGQPTDFGYDAFAELVFEDVGRFEQFMARVSEPEAAVKLRKDEEKFLDCAKMTAAAIDQVSVTSR